jgi:hypothetical protein
MHLCVVFLQELAAVFASKPRAALWQRHGLLFCFAQVAAAAGKGVINHVPPADTLFE